MHGAAPTNAMTHTAIQEHLDGKGPPSGWKRSVTSSMAGHNHPAPPQPFGRAPWTPGSFWFWAHRCWRHAWAGRQWPLRPKINIASASPNWRSILANSRPFKAAIKESVETSVRVEPGVLVLYAVSEKDDPARIRVFEIYTDADAYRTHLETPHFRKFRAVTETMVRSRKLLDAIPIAMGAKGR